MNVTLTEEMKHFLMKVVEDVQSRKDCCITVDKMPRNAHQSFYTFTKMDEDLHKLKYTIIFIIDTVVVARISFYDDLDVQYAYKCEPGDPEKVALFVKQGCRPYYRIVHATSSERSIPEVVEYLMEVGGDLYER